MTGSTETQDDGARADAGAGGVRRASHLFVVLECDRPTASGARFDVEGVGRIVIGRGPARGARRYVRDGVVTLHVEIPGRSLSRSHAALTRWHGQWQLEDLGSKNGVFVDGKQVDRWSFPSGGSFELGHTLFTLATQLVTPPDTDDRDLGDPSRPHDALASLLPALDAEARAFVRVAEAGIPILLRGETGTGKEIFARAAHGCSRPSGPFVAVQSGAMAPAVVEQALFGYDEGAFPGAVRDEPGFVRAAHGGTLFLDEVGDLPLSAQAALLRVLDEHVVFPVGSSRGVPVDVRVVAATHRDLDAAVARGMFRADLLARIAGYTHVLPPLRDHAMDLGALVAHVLLQERHGMDPARVILEPEVGRALVAYRWPLNAREVKQCLLSALALAGDETIRLEHLPASVAGRPVAADDAPELDDPGDDALRETLEAALRKANGNVAEVARSFGKGPTQIHRWMKRFGMNPALFRAR